MVKNWEFCHFVDQTDYFEQDGTILKIAKKKYKKNCRRRYFNYSKLKKLFLSSFLTAQSC